MVSTLRASVAMAGNWLLAMRSEWKRYTATKGFNVSVDDIEPFFADRDPPGRWCYDLADSLDEHIYVHLLYGGDSTLKIAYDSIWTVDDLEYVRIIVHGTRLWLELEMNLDACENIEILDFGSSIPGIVGHVCFEDMKPDEKQHPFFVNELEYAISVFPKLHLPM
jgi:hypothetical protein